MEKQRTKRPIVFQKHETAQVQVPKEILPQVNRLIDEVVARRLEERAAELRKRSAG